MGREIFFEVRGFPPIKNECKSMLAKDHPQATRVAESLICLGGYHVVTYSVS